MKNDNEAIKQNLRTIKAMTVQADELARNIRLRLDHAKQTTMLASLYLEQPNGLALDDLLGCSDYQSGVSDGWLEEAERQAQELLSRIGSIRGAIKRTQSAIRSRS